MTEETGDIEALADRVQALLADRPRVLVGIVGAPGAGKSTLADGVAAAALARGIPTAVLPMDGYHLADAALTALGRLERKGAIDTFDGAGYLAVLERVRDAGEIVWAPAFDRTIEQPIAGSIPVHPDVRLVLTEGNYLLTGDDPWCRVRDVLDEAWYVEIDDEERLRRLTARHIAFGKNAAAAREWVAGVDEPNARMIRATRNLADVIVHFS
jgi:pantothenate kinase